MGWKLSLRNQKKQLQEVSREQYIRRLLSTLGSKTSTTLIKTKANKADKTLGNSFTNLRKKIAYHQHPKVPNLPKKSILLSNSTSGFIRHLNVRLILMVSKWLSNSRALRIFISIISRKDYKTDQKLMLPDRDVARSQHFFY